MAVSPDHARITKLLTADIEAAPLSADEKANLIQGLEASLEATNGLTAEEKLQGTCVNVFWLSANLARLYLATAKAPPPETWKSVLIKCQFAVVLLALFVCVLLGFRPEVAGLLQSLAGVAVGG